MTDDAVSHHRIEQLVDGKRKKKSCQLGRSLPSWRSVRVETHHYTDGQANGGLGRPIPSVHRPLRPVVQPGQQSGNSHDLKVLVETSNQTWDGWRFNS